MSAQVAIKNNQFVPLHKVALTAQETEFDRVPMVKDARFSNVGALIIKVTHRCNLDCFYCYENIIKGNDMSLDTFKQLVDRVLANSSQKQIMFLFHGGEPTLVSEHWYSEAISYAKQIAVKFDKKPTFAMQSNILALSTSKIQMLKKLGIQLSVSMDGPSHLPNAMRKRADSAYETYKRLIDAGIQPGVLMTINHSNFSYFSEICSWLENEMEEKEFKANVVSSVGRGLDLPDLTAEQVFQAYHDILEYMIETEGQGIIEDNLRLELERFFASPMERETMPRTLCRDRKCGAGDRVIGITPEGDLLPCGRFQWDESEFFIGHLAHNSTHETTVSFRQAVTHFHSLVPETWDDCATCEAKNICSYGCQAFIVRSKSKANLDCIPTKMRYQYYLQNRTRLLPVIEAINAQNEKLVTMGYTDGGRDAGYQDYDDRGYKDYQDKNYSDKYEDYRDRNEYHDYKDKKETRDD